MTTLVYRYGIVGRPAIPEAMMAQLRLAHDMQNALVEAAHAQDTAKKEVWSTDLAVADIEAQLEDAEARVVELIEQAKKEHSTDRSTTTRSGTAQALREARTTTRELRVARRAAQAAAYPVLKPRFQVLRNEHKAAMKEVRQTYAGLGLHWGTYNAVMADHQTALKLIEQRRNAGQPAQLRFRRFDGTGTLTVQLQREHGPDCRCPACAARLLARWQVKAGQLSFGESSYPHTDDAAACAQVAEFVGIPAETVVLGEEGTGGVRRFKVAGEIPAWMSAPRDPVRSPELLASGLGKWRNVFRLTPWKDPAVYDKAPDRRQKAKRAGMVYFSLGGSAAIELPVRLHRMIPPEADVCEASITVTRLAGHHRLHLTVTVRLPDPEPVTGRPPVALHTGWRQRIDGSVRVGTWASHVPLEVPAHVAEVVHAHEGGRWGEIVLPASWLEVVGRPARLRSQRDLSLEPVARKLAAWLDEHPQEADEHGRGALTGADVRRWRAANRFAALSMRWRENPPAGGEEMATNLEAWRVQDKHLWEWEANERDQMTRRRDEYWRRVGAWLADHAGVVIIDDTDLAALRRKGDIADDDPVMPGEAAQAARARAALSAPGRLRQLAVAAAVRRGVAVHETPAKFLTRTCPHCAAVGDAHPRYATSAVVTCPSCVRTYDQDHSATVIMLNREHSAD